MYVYQMNILVPCEENPQLESKLDEAVASAIEKYNAELISADIEEIVGDNYGKCGKCGAWTSDWTHKDAIKSFSNGAKVDGTWLCDLCLPEYHSNAF